MFMDKVKERFDINKPIFTEDFLNIFSEYSRAYVFRLLKKSEISGEIIKFANGIYYLPKKTFFGFSTITADLVIERKYLNWNNDIYGIYSGLTLLNRFSITSQVPNIVEVVSNNEATRCRKITLDDRNFLVRKSRIEINSDNADVYLILQLFTDICTQTELNDFAKQKLIEFIKEKKITKMQLLSLAVHFPARTIKKMIGSGILNDVA